MNWGSLLFIHIHITFSVFLWLFACETSLLGERGGREGSGRALRVSTCMILGSFHGANWLVFLLIPFPSVRWGYKGWMVCRAFSDESTFFSKLVGSPCFGVCVVNITAEVLLFLVNLDWCWRCLRPRREDLMGVVSSFILSSFRLLFYFSCR